MARIRIKGEGGDLLDTLLEEGFFVDNPCNGKGICGKCKVKVRGSLKRPGGSYQELSEISRTERAHLSERRSPLTSVLPAWYRFWGMWRLNF